MKKYTLLSYSFSNCLIFVLGFLVIPFGCGKSGDGERDESTMVRFEFEHPTHNETFFAETSDLAVITKVRAELAKPKKDRSLHISGRIDRGANGRNGKWSWYFVPNEWRLAEMSMELCDSWPSYIEENLDTWLEEVGSFCPWSSRVSKEL